jgi:AraC-like DNA-binding protein
LSVHSFGFAVFDVLTDVLEQVRLAGTVYFSAELRAPWGVSVRPEGRAPFYVMTRGGCLLEVDGEPSPRALGAGDVALLPRAHAHVIRSGPGVPSVPFGQFVKDHPMDERGFVRCDGGAGPTSTIVGGFFLSQELEATPLLSALPAVVHLPAQDRQVASWLEPTLRFIGMEMDSRTHGSRSVLNRLADILFIQAVRAFLSTGTPIHAGWLKGLSDGQVARALALMHENYARAWTLGRLAREIGISRTVLAVRFRRLVGTSPILYLTRWRMLQAARLLRESRAGVAEVAEKVGYTSEAAFAKAFKRTLARTPGQVRRSAGRP